MSVLDKLVSSEDDIKDVKWNAGVISRTGVFYGCGYAGHNQLYRDLVDEKIIISDEPYAVFEDLGWVKLSIAHTQPNLQFLFDEANVLTEKQIKAIIDYAEARNKKEVSINWSWYKTSVLKNKKDIKASELRDLEHSYNKPYFS